jgi:SAM-dependent methyltransferase
MKELLSLTKSAERYATEVNTLPYIHLDDFIFRFLIDNQSFDSPDSAVKYYFNDGLKSAQQLAGLLKSLMPVNTPLTMLEFASGYGCVTRHIRSELPEVNSVACDIHIQAVDFITTKLSAEAILSCADPKDFPKDKQYDVVFALSFFSHMPYSTWSQWLTALYNAVAPGGAFIFTTQGLHSAKYFGEPKLDETGFWFLADSEQKDLDVATYGQTIVSESFVRGEIMDKLGRQAEVVNLGYWWEHQDCYIVRKM